MLNSMPPFECECFLLRHLHSLLLVIRRFQRHIEELLENRDQEDVENIKAQVQRAVEKTLLGKKFDGTISGAVEASIKVFFNAATLSNSPCLLVCNHHE